EQPQTGPANQPEALPQIAQALKEIPLEHGVQTSAGDYFDDSDGAQSISCCRHLHSPKALCRHSGNGSTHCWTSKPSGVSSLQYRSWQFYSSPPPAKTTRCPLPAATRSTT